MNINELCESIQQDLKIDKFNLTDAACENAVLFGKYQVLYRKHNLVLFKLEKSLDKLIQEKTDYYQGNAPAEVYKEKPFDKIIRSNSVLEKYLASDDDIINAKEKMFIAKQSVELLKDTCDYIRVSRGFGIKTALDNIKFEHGV